MVKSLICFLNVVYFQVYSLDTPKAFHSFYGPEPSDQAQRFQYSEVLTYLYKLNLIYRLRFQN